MGNNQTYVTAQVNMPGRRMPYWIFQFNEIVAFLIEKNYSLVYKSTNYQPFHNFDNFPIENEVKDSCNILFKKNN